jgi:lipopolysaccharide export system permease protein
LIKTLDRFVLKSFILPFILTFFVVVFILLMQFVWKYIDDLVGKGLEMKLLFELLFYVSITLTPMALPLALLLSSNMAFGNLAERYELTSLKSAGISLQRILAPIFILVIALSISLFFFSNYVLPIVHLRQSALLYDITNQKPAIDIREGVFYNGIENYTIKVGKKSKDGQWLYNLMIYDHSQFYGNNKIIVAESGHMQFTNDKNYLILTIYNGNSYDDIKNVNNNEYKPMMRTSFKKHILRMDLSEFKITRSDKNLFKDGYQMLNTKQLRLEIDTIRNEINTKKNLVLKEINQIANNTKVAMYSPPSAQLTYETNLKKVDEIYTYWNSLNSQQKKSLIDISLTNLRSHKALIENNKMENDMYREYISHYEIEYYKKYTLSFACIVLFIIGAPLGAIIKKGGLGMPVVVSVCFFLLFYVLSIIGEKSAKEGAMSAFEGAWLASVVLLPIGLFLSYKASRDSVLFDRDFYLKLFYKLKRSKA